MTTPPTNPYMGLTQEEIVDIYYALLLDGGWTEEEDDLLWDAQFFATPLSHWQQAILEIAAEAGKQGRKLRLG